MGLTYRVSIRCLPGCKDHEPDWQYIGVAHALDLAEVIGDLKDYPKIKNHKVAISINEETDD